MAQVPRDFDRWVQLRLAIGQESIEVSYLDETGYSARPTYDRVYDTLGVRDIFFRRRFTRQFAWLFDGVVTIPGELQQLLVAGFSEFSRLRYHLLPNDTSQMVPWLLPIFVVPPPGLEALPWELFVQEGILVSLGVQDRCVAVRSQKSQAKEAAFALPLRVHDSRAFSTSMRALRSRRWYAQEEAVQTHGVQLTDATSEPPAHGERLEPHILVQNGAARAGQISKRRLGLTVEAFDEEVELLPFSSSGPVLRIYRRLGSPVDDLDPIVNLVYGFVHDYSLHELVWILRKTQPGYAFDLCCGPRTNLALRLSTAMSEMRTEYLSELGTGGRLHQRGVERAVLAAVDTLTSDFTQERLGLTSMAKAMAAMRKMEALPQRATPFGPTPNEDGRRVEMLLDRYDEFGVTFPLRKGQLWEPLRAGWRYRLGVQIGLPSFQFGIFDEPPPSIDSAIAWDAVADEALELEVCVFAKSFKLLSRTTKTLVLAKSGGPSRLVHFELKAPTTAGTHDLRVSIYARNNLVQSFQLTALVFDPANRGNTNRNHQTDSRAITVRLTSSAVEDLADAHELPSRALSVALNDDAKPGDHTLMIKSTLQGVSARADESKIASINARYRDVLKAAHMGQISWAATIRDMAKVGSGIWSWLAGASRSESILNFLRCEGETLQFVRHSSVLSMPWHLIYDFELPTEGAWKAPEICCAKLDVIADWPKAGELGCRHRPGKPVICVEGFWAFRHKLELLSEEAADGKTSTRANPAVQVPAPHPLLTFGASLGTTLEKATETEWSNTYKERFHRITPADAPVPNGLWNAALLPAVLLLLSHLHEEDESVNLEARVYACAPTGLRDHEISALRLRAAKVNLDPWNALRPIVLLMACDSARQDTHQLVTLTDAFLQAGASAVIGTEWTVRAGEALAFGQRAADLLLGGGDSTLGDVMQDYYCKALTAGKGVPMLFTAYGNADLYVVN